MRSFIIAIIICFSPILSQTGYEIAKRVDEKPKPRFLSNKIEMVLKNSRDKTRTKQMISKSMNGGEKQIMWFLKPKTDYGVSFLKIEHDKGQDEMRIWLPNFGRVRRISSKKKGDSFMGSDLSYEDLSNRNLNDNKYIRLEDETVDEINCYVLEIRPIGNIKTSYSKHISCINKSTLVTKKEKSYDKKGNLIKDKSFDYIFVEGYSVLNYVFIKNVQKNHTTQVYFSEIVLNSKIDEDIFNEKSLQNMPVD